MRRRHWRPWRADESTAVLRQSRYDAGRPARVRGGRSLLWRRIGNAGSASHSYGQRAARAVERARHQTAAAVGATAAEVLFTSGATESINLAIQGACLAHRGERRQLITCATEHKAVLDTCAAMKRLGFETVVLPVDNDGMLDLDALREALKRPTLMVAVMAVNNEIGVVQDVGAICEMAKSAGAWTFVDGAQARGVSGSSFSAGGGSLLG